MPKQPQCHPTREYWAKDLCKACYLSDYYHANLDRLRQRAHYYYLLKRNDNRKATT